MTSVVVVLHVGEYALGLAIDGELDVEERAAAFEEGEFERGYFFEATCELVESVSEMSLELVPHFLGDLTAHRRFQR